MPFIKTYTYEIRTQLLNADKTLFPTHNLQISGKLLQKKNSKASSDASTYHLTPTDDSLKKLSHLLLLINVALLFSQHDLFYHNKSFCQRLNCSFSKHFAVFWHLPLRHHSGHSEEFLAFRTHKLQYFLKRITSACTLFN